MRRLGAVDRFRRGSSCSPLETQVTTFRKTPCFASLRRSPVWQSAGNPAGLVECFAPPAAAAASSSAYYGLGPTIDMLPIVSGKFQSLLLLHGDACDSSGFPRIAHALRRRERGKSGGGSASRGD